MATKTIPKKFTIQRHGWHRGRSGAQLLVPSTGLKCCLGFFCLESGYSPDEIRGAGMPEDAKVGYSRKVNFNHSFQKYSAPSVFTRIGAVNDDTIITDAQREAKLKELFGEIGVLVSFEN